MVCMILLLILHTRPVADKAQSSFLGDYGEVDVDINLPHTQE